MTVDIDAKEIYNNDLFSEKFLFEIPPFQRPFSWTNENFDQLFEDLNDAITNNQSSFDEKVKEYEPYFLGSIILCEKESSSDGAGLYDVIDGQQRLTSLVILMAVLRDLATKEKAYKNLSEKIYQEEDEFAGTPESIRLRVREKEKDFFKTNVLTPKSTREIDNVDVSSLSEPKKNMVDAVKTFRSKLINEENNANQKLINNMTKYILQKLVMVVVKTNSIYSAFRLFNVINARGMPLSNSDLLKSENLREIKDKNIRDKYARLWEDIEEEVGREEMEDLISFIRSIKLKEKARSSIYEEFDKKVFKQEERFKGKPFIDFLYKVKDIYQNKILDADIFTSDERKNVYYHNLVSLMYNYLPFKDWMIAVIRFSQKFDDEALYKFIKKYEKRIAVDWIKGLGYTARLSQIYRIVKLIEENEEEYIFNAELLSIDRKEISSLEDSLDNRDFYRKGRWQIPKYVLLRIDLSLRNNESVKINYGDNITVEHILPRRANNDYWVNRFNEQERYEWTNRLGNLVPLNGRKNTRASNKAFTKKVRKYFDKDKNDFVLVDKLKKYDDWNIDNLSKRHRKLIEIVIDLWCN